MWSAKLRETQSPKKEVGTSKRATPWRRSDSRSGSIQVT